MPVRRWRVAPRSPTHAPLRPIRLHELPPVAYGRPLRGGPPPLRRAAADGCADPPGIVAAVSGFPFARGANIVSSQHYSTDPAGGRIFLRTEFFLEDPLARESFQEAIEAEVAKRFEMDWQIRWLGGAPARSDPRLTPRPLPAGPALALAPRGARRGDRHGDLKPPRPRGRDARV
jgi:hypothetical protein